MRHLPKVLIFMLIFPLLSGCWDRREIEDRSFVSAIAIDSAEEEGQAEISVQIPIPNKVTGGGSGGGGGDSADGKGPSGPFELLSGVGKTYTEAMHQIISSANDPLFFGNMQVIMISEEQAKKGIEPFMDALKRTSEVRRQLYPVVVKGKAKEALNIKVPSEEIPTNYIRGMLRSGTKNGIFTDVTFGQLLIDMEIPNCQFPVMNYLEPIEGGYKWDGVAVFNRDKMVGMIHGREDIAGVLQVRTNQRGHVVIAPRSDGAIAFHPYRSGRKIKVKPDGSIEIHIEVTGFIQEKTSKDDLSKVEVIQDVSNQVATIYQDRMKRLITRSQKELQADVLNLGKYVRAYQPKFYNSINWQEEYPNIRITTKYHVTIHRYGISSD
ncbi:Ger(x)C family germination protein [Croceifilum oryzae]|uniref:Ger(X)C family germination protein n=1 Tax=Croceifilum oryzae TaxID=1553429 RepID=A0AAJ1WV46_9BACL|nr:Ger(x)C family spore germination protein [Croceifilum oryzae]MDQ0418631.1 Ger(x)C family germination protein [Croceifilum oryzae]